MTSPINTIKAWLSVWGVRAVRWLIPDSPNDAALQPVPIRPTEARPVRR